MLAVKADPNADALVKAVADDFTTSEGRGLRAGGREGRRLGQRKAGGHRRQGARYALRQAGALLDSKAPADAVPFKTWLVHVAKAVAEAAPEGGFLGFGGTQVSEAEKATVAQIAAGLGVQV